MLKPRPLCRSSPRVYRSLEFTRLDFCSTCVCCVGRHPGSTDPSSLRGWTFVPLVSVVSDVTQGLQIPRVYEVGLLFHLCLLCRSSPRVDRSLEFTRLGFCSTCVCCVGRHPGSTDPSSLRGWTFVPLVSVVSVVTQGLQIPRVYEVGLLFHLCLLCRSSPRVDRSLEFTRLDYCSTCVCCVGRHPGSTDPSSLRGWTFVPLLSVVSVVTQGLQITRVYEVGLLFHFCLLCRSSSRVYRSLEFTRLDFCSTSVCCVGRHPGSTDPSSLRGWTFVPLVSVVSIVTQGLQIPRVYEVGLLYHLCKLCRSSPRVYRSLEFTRLDFCSTCVCCVGRPPGSTDPSSLRGWTFVPLVSVVSVVTQGLQITRVYEVGLLFHLCLLCRSSSRVYRSLEFTRLDFCSTCVCCVGRHPGSTDHSSLRGWTFVPLVSVVSVVTQGLQIPRVYEVGLLFHLCLLCRSSPRVYRSLEFTRLDYCSTWVCCVGRHPGSTDPSSLRGWTFVPLGSVVSVVTQGLQIPRVYEVGLLFHFCLLCRSSPRVYRSLEFTRLDFCSTCVCCVGRHPGSTDPSSLRGWTFVPLVSLVSDVTQGLQIPRVYEVGLLFHLCLLCRSSPRVYRSLEFTRLDFCSTCVCCVGRHPGSTDPSSLRGWTIVPLV